MAQLVSIIIPCFNAERWISEAIQSCLDQTYQPIEVIVIDDGSTDKSLEVIKSFGDKIRWETGPNRGGCAARNRGIKLANGSYLQFLDADDLLHPNKIASQMLVIAGRTDVAVNGRLVRFSGPAPAWSTLQLPDCPSFEISALEFGIRKRLGEICRWVNPANDPVIGHSLPHCWLIPKELAYKIGDWDESLTMAQDNEHFDRLYLEAHGVCFDGTSVVGYRIGNQSSVSAGRSRAHAESLLRYCEASRRVLEHDNSVRARISVARGYYFCVQTMYPQHPDLVRYALKAIHSLEIPRGAEIDSPRLRLISLVFGRRIAIRLQRLVRR